MEIEVLGCYTGVTSLLHLPTHYFLIVPILKLEIHPGRYYMGSYHTLGFTKKYNVYKKSRVCEFCFKNLISLSLKLESVWFYPFINCETLTRGLLTNDIAISYQMLYVTTLFLSVVASWFKFSVLLLTLVLAVIIITVNYYHSSPTTVEECVHLNNRNNTSLPTNQKYFFKASNT